MDKRRKIVSIQVKTETFSLSSTYYFRQRGPYIARTYSRTAITSKCRFFTHLREKCSMSSPIRSFMVPRSEAATTKWARRRDIPIAILAWITLVLVILWGAGHITRTILLLIVAALLAYALAPGVKLLQRFIPRALAIHISYVIVLV